MKNELNVLLKEIEIPQIVKVKANEAFVQIKEDRKPAVMTIQKKKHYVRSLKAASIVLLCLFLLGTTISAQALITNYKERLKNMTEEEMEKIDHVANAEEANRFSRNLTVDERARLDKLEAEYKNNGIFPEWEIKKLDPKETYNGETIALEESARMFYLPERNLTDEELLQLTDYDYKLNYVIDKGIEERFLQSNPWIERMEEFSSEEIDRIYKAMFSAEVHVSGGYSRKLSVSEQSNYNRLVKRYEQDNIYPENEIEIITFAELFDGNTAVLCVEDAMYYLPDRELTEMEILKVMDFSHKANYAVNKISKEVREGIREGYPK